MCIYSRRVCVYTPSVLLPVPFQPGLSAGGSEKNVVSISFMFLVTVSFLPVSVFEVFERIFLHLDCSPFCSTMQISLFGSVLNPPFIAPVVDRF